MVRDRARKQDARAAQGTDSYARTARLAGGKSWSTAQVNAELIAAFEQAGWPVVAESTLEADGMWSSHPGPGWMLVSRRGYDHAEMNEDFDPDDPEQADQRTVPTVTFNAPAAVALTDEFVSTELPGEQPPARIVEMASELLARARAKAVAAATPDAACAICGDEYAAAHLLHPTTDDGLSVCPSCAFDGDLITAAFPHRLAYEFDRLAFEDLAVPAGWAAVAATLAYAAGPGIEAELEHAWDRVLEVPLEHWAAPGNLWIWLPPADRPAALEKLGPGASLSTVAAAIDAAHPDLRERFRRRLAENLEDDEPDAGQVPHDYLLEQLWPAAIAYAVTLATDGVERFGQHPPVVDMSDCLEEGVLADHFAQLGSALRPDDDLDVLFTLEVGAMVIAEALGWTAGAQLHGR